MDLSVVPERQCVRIKDPVFGILISIVAEPGDSCVIVPLNLAAGLRVVRCFEHVIDLYGLTDVLKKMLCELFHAYYCTILVSTNIVQEYA